ncbi:MAG: DUF3108 domain-containing protein [Gammaproteobacteria bacterium]|nr:DUF3108 domain-containing protein [Gammaproteobacteria bacterium]
MKTSCIVASLLFLSIASSAQAETFRFQNYQAAYTLGYDGIPFGKSITTLSVDAKNHYILCIANKPTLSFIHGAVTECSKGLIFKNTVKPLSYDYYYKRNKNHNNIHIDFDWAKNIATMKTQKTTWHIAIPQNTQDKISYQLLLRRGLAEGVTAFSFPVADGGKLKIYQFNVVHQQNNTIKLDRTPIPHKESISLWFRPDLNYLVSKVRQTKNIADIGTAELIAYTPLDTHV